MKARTRSIAVAGVLVAAAVTVLASRHWRQEPVVREAPPLAGQAGTAAQPLHAAMPSSTGTHPAGPTFTDLAETGHVRQLALADGAGIEGRAGAVSSDVGDPTVAAERVATATPVPEPQGMAMMLAGVGLVGWIVRRRRRG